MVPHYASVTAYINIGALAGCAKSCKRPQVASALLHCLRHLKNIKIKIPKQIITIKRKVNQFECLCQIGLLNISSSCSEYELSLCSATFSSSKLSYWILRGFNFDSCFKSHFSIFSALVIDVRHMWIGIFGSIALD